MLSCQVGVTGGLLTGRQRQPAIWNSRNVFYVPSAKPVCTVQEARGYLCSPPRVLDGGECVPCRGTGGLPYEGMSQPPVSPDYEVGEEATLTVMVALPRDIKGRIIIIMVGMCGARGRLSPHNPG